MSRAVYFFEWLPAGYKEFTFKSWVGAELMVDSQLAIILVLLFLRTDIQTISSHCGSGCVDLMTLILCI